MSQGLRLVTIGGAIGVGAAYVLAILASSRLYGVTAGDPLVLGAATTAVAMFALTAFFLPARQASLRSPADGLASE